MAASSPPSSHSLPRLERGGREGRKEGRKGKHILIILPLISSHLWRGRRKKEKEEGLYIGPPSSPFLPLPPGEEEGGMKRRALRGGLCEKGRRAL